MLPKFLYVTRDESRWVFRGPSHFQQELARTADVTFHRTSGSIHDILRGLPAKPDVIVLHMQPLPAAPLIHDLSDVGILKAMYVEDVHYRPDYLAAFAEESGIHFVFCPYREHFHRNLPEIQERFRWLPHSVDTTVFRDWGLSKTTDVLLLGQVDDMYYPFRHRVADRLEKEPWFVRHPHPGYVDVADDDPRYLVGTRYAQAMNQARLFITCGSRWRIPVAKHMEAPACRTCLLAPHGADLADLGFVDGETFVACEEDDFEEKVRFCLSDARTRLRITDQGYQLVMERHTTKQRVQEFLAAIEGAL